MSKGKLSVMDRLKAIRERMAVPAGEVVEEDRRPEGTPDPARDDDQALAPADAGEPAPGADVPEWAARGAEFSYDTASIAAAWAPEGATGAAPEDEPDPGAPGGAVHMWDVVIDGDEDAPPPLPDLDLKAPDLPVPPPVAPVAEAARPARRSGRVKTRLLGFEHSDGQTVDVFQNDPRGVRAAEKRFPVGWLVIVKGPGRGEAISLQAGVSQIGRDEDQAVQLDFGDTSISRSNHAAVAYDEEARQFYIGHGGKSNIVRLNGKPLLSTEAIKNGALIRIGETTLRLVALCGKDFNWSEEEPGPKPEKS